MAGLTSTDAIYVALAFIVPGFVFYAVRSQFITGQDQTGQEHFVRFLCYSACNYAMFGWLVFLVVELQAGPIFKSLTWVLVTLLGPAALGFAWGVGAQRDWFRKLYRMVGLNPVHAVPTAWDYKFGRMGGEWVLITLKDGTRFAGFCGAASFASSDPKERDLFLQAVFDLNDNDEWVPTKKSLLVGHGEIRTAEFWPVKEESPHV